MALPDFEAWAIFAKVARIGSFSGAATELGMSKATISKAVARLENRLGAPLIHRTSRRLALTEIGRQSLERAERMVLEAESAEQETSSQAVSPRGHVRLTAPAYFGIAHIAPLLPGLLAAFPGLTIDLHLGDKAVDLVGEGFDLAVRIGALEDSSLRARRLCTVNVVLAGAPSYFERHGSPVHPRDLANRPCFAYAYQRDLSWHFTSRTGKRVDIVPTGPLRSNAGEAFLPLLRAGGGLAMLPEFLIWPDLEAGALQAVLCDWELPPSALNLVTPPGAQRPARVKVVMDLLARHLSSAPWARKLAAAPADPP